jgi:hypothetical protein
MGFSPDIFSEKDLASLADIAIRLKNERKSKQNTAGDLGLLRRTGRTDKERDVQAEESLSFSQSEVPTPGPLTKKTLLNYNVLQSVVYL